MALFCFLAGFGFETEDDFLLALALVYDRSGDCGTGNQRLADERLLFVSNQKDLIKGDFVAIVLELFDGDHIAPADDVLFPPCFDDGESVHDLNACNPSSPSGTAAAPRDKWAMPMHIPSENVYIY